MKAILLFVVFFASAHLTLISQITTTPIADQQTSEVLPYDSTANFVGLNAKQYIGQELYLKPLTPILRKHGYRGFFTVNASPTRYKSNHDELAGKYFYVLDVLKHPNAHESPKQYGSRFYLKLKDKENAEICYFDYHGDFIYYFPFIVVGHWEKLKKENVGKLFILRYIDDELYDFRTGKKIDFENGSIWTFAEITIAEPDYFMVYLFENGKGETIMSGGNKGKVTYWPKEIALDYKERFGEYWKDILECKVIIGMTAEMVKLSWGEPNKINRASYGEQWVYGEQYLYFDNSILKSFN